MKQFKVHGVLIEAKSYDEACSIRFNCSIAAAIADRDEPQSEADLIARFIDAAGIAPTKSQIADMCPDSDQSIADSADFYRES